MDKFLQIFKDKVKKIKHAEMTQTDWDEFVSFKKNHDFPISKGSKSFSISKTAMVAAASFIGIAVFAVFISKQYFQKPDLTIENAKTEYTIDDSLNMKTKKEADESNPVKSKNDTLKKIDTEIALKSKTELFNNSDPKNKIKKLRKNPVSSVSGEILNKSEFQNIRSIAKNTEKNKTNLINKNNIVNNSNTEDISNLKIYDTNALQKFISSTELLNPDNLLHIEYIPALGSSNMVYRSKPLFDTSVLKVVVPETKDNKAKRFLITGSLAYVKALKDRLDADNINKKSISGSYYLTKRFRIGANYSIYSYHSLISKMEKYPSLADIKPHHPDEILEDMKLKASIKKAGIDFKYDVFQKQRFIVFIGSGIQRELYTNFDFKLNVRDKFGKHYFQDQQHKIINNPRYFLIPKSGIEYRILDNIRISGEIQYELSLSEMHEKYLSFDAGVTYCF